MRTIMLITFLASCGGDSGSSAPTVSVASLSLTEREDYERPGRRVIEAEIELTGEDYIYWKNAAAIAEGSEAPSDCVSGDDQEIELLDPEFDNLAPNTRYAVRACAFEQDSGTYVIGPEKSILTGAAE